MVVGVGVDVNDAAKGEPCSGRSRLRNRRFGTVDLVPKKSAVSDRIGDCFLASWLAVSLLLGLGGGAGGGSTGLVENGDEKKACVLL